MKMFLKNQPKKIKDIDRKDGIFRWMHRIGAQLPPWETVDKALQCDYGYYYHSSLKILSYPIQEDIFENKDTDSVAFYIWNMYGLKWRAYWDALNKQYDIIATDHKLTKIDDDKKETILNIIRSKEFENIVRDIMNNSTDKKDIMSNINDTIKGSSNSNKNSSQDSSSSSSLKSVGTNSSTNDSNTIDSEFVNDDIYGFNSVYPSDSNDSKTTKDNHKKDVSDSINESNDSKTSHDSTRSSDNDTTNTETSEFTNEELSEKYTREDTQKGRTGTDKNKEDTVNKDDTSFRDIITDEHGRRGVSPQSLIEEELELRKKIFLDIVYGDIDKLITIQVY